MTDHNEAMRLADELVAPIGKQISYWAAQEAAALLRQLSAERDQLRAEVERLRVDAERYLWLRDNQLLAKTQYMPTSPREYLDTAIDQARTTHKDTE